MCVSSKVPAGHWQAATVVLAAADTVFQGHAEHVAAILGTNSLLNWFAGHFKAAHAAPGEHVQLLMLEAPSSEVKPVGQCRHGPLLTLGLYCPAGHAHGPNASSSLTCMLLRLG